MSPVVLVPRDELLQAALHDAGHPVGLAHVAHEPYWAGIRLTCQTDQYQQRCHFHVVPLTQSSNH